MGWLDDITDIPWQQIWEKIQNTTKQWSETMPKLKGNQELVAPVSKERLMQGIKPQGQSSAMDLQALTPVPPPTPAPFIYDYGPYIVNPEAVKAKYPNGIPQLEGQSSDLVRQYMPNDATPAAIAILTESGNNPRAEGTNKDGSTDRGLGQINSATFADYQRRMGNKMADMGINTYQDMFDPEKNIQMMDLIRKYQGWGAWYGPQNYGFDLKKSTQ